MKKVMFFLMLFCGVILSSCSYHPTENPVTDPVEVEIVKSYVDDLGHKRFILSDGGMVEVRISQGADDNKIVFWAQDLKHRYIISWYSVSNIDMQQFNKWLDAEVGRHAMKYVGAAKDVYYDLIIEPDIRIERKVVRVKKYDGNLNEIHGSLKISGGFLCGSSGSGRLSGEGFGCENMFVNLYFDDRAPVSVDARENRLWLDVEEGDTIVEERINGKTFFSPKY